MIQRLWQPLHCDDAQAEALVRELGIAPVTARLLCIRGISDVTEARRFLSPSLDDLLDPFALTDMTASFFAVERRNRSPRMRTCAGFIWGPSSGWTKMDYRFSG